MNEIDEQSLFYEAFTAPPRQGPGSNEQTRRAFSLISGLPEKPKILDIGCGAGMQTLELARLTKGKIIALDNYKPLLDRIDENQNKKKVSASVKTKLCSMFEIPFEDEEFDLIWSEGAIYIIGFGRGLKEWQRYLKPGGWIAVTEISWIKENPPKECLEFWNVEYPAMTGIEENLGIIGKQGLDTVGHFILPKESWMDEYYTPLEAKIREMKDKYAGNIKAMELLAMGEKEIETFRKYSDYYSYVFFVMRKPV